MKPLELTEEHKSKLLEMCKELFPIYNHHYPDEAGVLYMYIPETDEEDPQETYIGQEVNIHWYEFCMTHLVKALWPNNYELFAYDGRQLSKDNHPVDFLYDEFKQKFVKLSPIMKTIFNILEEKFGVSGDITPQSTITDDCGLDSLDYIELIMELEVRYKIHITDEDINLKFNHLSTLQDVENYLISRNVSK